MAGRQFRWVQGLLAAALLALLAGLAQQAGLASSLDTRILDGLLQLNRRLQPQAVRIDPVLVGIDEAFLDAIEEPLSLSHLHLSRFLAAMVLAKAQVVGLDLALPDKRFHTLSLTSQPGVDFHRTLLAGLLATSRALPVVAAKVWDDDRNRFREVQLDYTAALSMQERGMEPLASALFCQDRDGRIRVYPGRNCQPGAADATFAGEIAAAMGKRESWSGLVNYQIGAPFTYVPMRDVLTMAAVNDVVGLQKLFKDRPVLLGTTLDGTDQLELPVPLAAWRPGSHRVPGVVAHAQTLRSMLNQGFVQPVPSWITVPLVAALALFWFNAAVLRKFLLFGFVAAALLVACAQLLLAGHWLAPGAMLMTGLAGCAGRSALEGWRSFRERRRLSMTFSGYVSPSVMREIVAGGVSAQQGGSKRKVCVLFSDIRNFTTLSERLPPEEVVALLNRYFARMTAVVHRHEGTVDKFIGDGLMAFFGAPNVLVAPEKNALDAAHAMQRALAELNAELAREGHAPLAIGIGLHSGEAVIGYIGSAERHAYTAIGDTVNAAARIEGLCKELGYPVLCSIAVARAAGFPAFLDPLGAQALKGRSAIDVYGARFC